MTCPGLEPDRPRHGLERSGVKPGTRRDPRNLRSAPSNFRRLLSKPAASWQFRKPAAPARIGLRGAGRGIAVQRDEYHSKALECARAAGQCGDPLERLRLLGVARQFALLASHVGAWRGLGARSHDNEAAAGATASCIPKQRCQSVMHQDCDQDDDWKRNSDQPKKQASSKAHGLFLDARCVV